LSPLEAALLGGANISFDRRKLAYLNAIEKLNCDYANGILTYAREIASRTEQFWCPIKHAAMPRATGIGLKACGHAFRMKRIPCFDPFGASAGADQHQGRTQPPCVVFS
jgi:hypothetical protein